jgi:hypothetical protein
MTDRLFVKFILLTMQCIMFYTAFIAIAIRNYIIFHQFHIQWYNFVLCMDLWNVDK